MNLMIAHSEKPVILASKHNGTLDVSEKPVIPAKAGIQKIEMCTQAGN